MKSLRAFWHWVDNEKPAELESEHFRHLSDLADLALDTAGDMVGERIGQPHAYVGRLRDHWPAVRDLSFAICEALEKMHEAVPVPVPVPSAYRFEGPIVFDEMATFRDVGLALLRPEPRDYVYRREYQGEWVERTDPRPPHHRGKTSSVYDDATRRLDIYPATSVEALDNIRGYSPRTITVHGKPSDYVPDALVYLPQVVQPMLVAAGAGGMLCTPDDTLEAFGL